jgi:hypothetical protein
MPLAGILASLFRVQCNNNLLLDITPETSLWQAKQILQNWVELIKTHRVAHLFDTVQGLAGHVHKIQQELRRLGSLINQPFDQDFVIAISNAKNEIYHALLSAKDASNG